MSAENIEKFFDKVEADTELQAKVKAVASLDELIDLANGEGFSFEVDDLAKVIRAKEITEDELIGVSGGNGKFQDLMGTYSKLSDKVTKLVGAFNDVSSKFIQNIR